MPTDPPADTPAAPRVAAPSDPHAAASSDPPRKVAFVITRGDSIGGAQIHVRDLAAHLRAQGVDVVVCVGSTGPFTEDLDRLGVRRRLCPELARSMNPVRDLKAVRELHRALLVERPDLLSAHTAKAGLVGRLAAAWAGIPAIFTAHGWQFAPGIALRQRAIVYCLELLLSRLPASARRRGGGAGRVITVSRFDHRLARRTAAVPASRLHLVYNGLPDVPLDARRPGPAYHAADRAIPRIIMTARFQEQKDHATLLRAMRDVPGVWHLLLVGEEGPLAQRIRDLAADLGFSCGAGGPESPAQPCRVDFLGHRRDVAELLDSSDIFCLVSRWEGLPRSIIEAMRAGLPTIATDVGGVRELVQHGRTGYLVPPGNPALLAQRLRELICAQSLRRRMGTAARASYEASFTFDAMYHNTVRVWRHALGPAYSSGRR